MIVIDAFVPGETEALAEHASLKIFCNCNCKLAKKRFGITHFYVMLLRTAVMLFDRRVFPRIGLPKLV